MKVCEVLLTNDAARDLEEMYQYIALHDSPQKADDVLSRIEKEFSSLSEFPERESIRRNYWRWGFANTARFFLNPIASFTGL